MKKGQKKPKNSKNKEISLDTKILFSYEISHLQYKDKIRFYYALKGRDGKSGILSRTKTFQVNKGVLLVSQKFDLEFQDFFRFWGCKFTRMKVRIENE